MEFDASIDLVASQVPDWLPPEDAVRRVREAVEALPGAGWVSVEWCGNAPHVRWIRLYRPGHGAVMEGPPWDHLQARIEAVVGHAIAANGG